MSRTLLPPESNQGFTDKYRHDSSNIQSSNSRFPYENISQMSPSYQPLCYRDSTAQIPSSNGDFFNNSKSVRERKSSALLQTVKTSDLTNPTKTNSFDIDNKYDHLLSKIVALPDIKSQKYVYEDDLYQNIHNNTFTKNAQITNRTKTITKNKSTNSIGNALNNDTADIQSPAHTSTKKTKINKNKERNNDKSSVLTNYAATKMSSPHKAISCPIVSPAFGINNPPSTVDPTRGLKYEHILSRKTHSVSRQMTKSNEPKTVYRFRHLSSNGKAIGNVNNTDEDNYNELNAEGFTNKTATKRVKNDVDLTAGSYEHKNGATRGGEWIVLRDYKLTDRCGYGEEFNIWTREDDPRDCVSPKLGLEDESKSKLPKGAGLSSNPENYKYPSIPSHNSSRDNTIPPQIQHLLVKSDSPKLAINQEENMLNTHFNITPSTHHHNQRKRLLLNRPTTHEYNFNFRLLQPELQRRKNGITQDVSVMQGSSGWGHFPKCFLSNKANMLSLTLDKSVNNLTNQKPDMAECAPSQLITDRFRGNSTCLNSDKHKTTSSKSKHECVCQNGCHQSLFAHHYRRDNQSDMDTIDNNVSRNNMHYQCDMQGRERKYNDISCDDDNLNQFETTKFAETQQEMLDYLWSYRVMSRRVLGHQSVPKEHFHDCGQNEKHKSITMLTDASNIEEKDMVFTSDNPPKVKNIPRNSIERKPTGIGHIVLNSNEQGAKDIHTNSKGHVRQLIVKMPYVEIREHE